MRWRSRGQANCRVTPRTTKPVATSLTTDERMKKIDDLLLAGSCTVELPPHLGEAAIDLCEGLIDLLETSVPIGAEVDEIFPQCVEARRGSLAEVQDLATNLTDIAVRGSGEHARRRRILLADPHSAPQVAYLAFECLDARFQVPRFHAPEPTQCLAAQSCCLSVACFDRRDYGVRLRATDVLQVNRADGKQVIDATFEIPRGEVGIEVRARASGTWADVSVTRQRVRRDVEVLSGPRERYGGSVELFVGHFLFVEVPFADDEKVAGRVVVGRGVAYQFWSSQLEDVSVPIDADVISDVDPPLRILVVSLMLA